MHSLLPIIEQLDKTKFGDQYDSLIKIHVNQMQSLFRDIDTFTELVSEMKWWETVISTKNAGMRFAHYKEISNTS